MDRKKRIAAKQRTPYSADSALHVLWDKYPMIPTTSPTWPMSMISGWSITAETLHAPTSSPALAWAPAR